MGVATACKLGRLHVEAECRERRCAGAVLVWNDRETEVADLAEVEALFLALVSRSPGTEIIFLNQDLAIGAASVLRDLHAHFLGAFSLRLLNLVDEPRDRLRPVEFHEDMLDDIGTRSDPTRGFRAGVTVQQMLDRVVRRFRRVSDRRAADDVDLARSTGIRRRTGCQWSLAKLRKVHHSVRQKVGRPPWRGSHSLRT